MECQFAKHRVEHFGEQWRGVGARDGVIFEYEKSGEGQVAPEASPLEVVCEAQEGHHEGGAGVEGEGGSLYAGDQVIANGFAVLPLQHVGTEALVGEAFDGVGKGVLGGFEIDKIGLGRRMSD